MDRPDGHVTHQWRQQMPPLYICKCTIIGKNSLFFFKGCYLQKLWYNNFNLLNEVTDDGSQKPQKPFHALRLL